MSGIALKSARQRWRLALLLASFIAFPVTINYFSPYLVVDSAFQGIVNGSLVVFGSMFVGSLLFGRLWCGWMCPAAGIQEVSMRVNDRRIPGWANRVKWFIWVPWIGLIVRGAVTAGGYRTVDLLYGTVGGISVAGEPDRPIWIAYAIYFGVVVLFFGLALLFGRRSGCHSVCWMSPFMIGGRALRNTVAWPSLRLVADSDVCTSCGRCARECPMSLDVSQMVAQGRMEQAECILCGTCADACPSKAIRYSFSAGR